MENIERREQFVMFVFGHFFNAHPFSRLIRMSNTRQAVIAQCTEYSIESFGGTETLVRTLVRGLSPHFRIVLVSNDDSETIARSEFASLIEAHIPWRPDTASPTAARNLAGQLRKNHVDLAHFHFGGNYGWDNRAFNRCPLLHVHRGGIPCVSTNHGAFALLDGYCASWRPLWMKIALLPVAWLSKMHVIAHVETEVAVSTNDLRNLQTWYWPLRRKFRQIYHSRIREDYLPAPNPSRRQVILCVGTIGPRKGQTFLVEAFCRLAAKFRDWQLVLIGREGDVAMMRRIRELIAQNDLERQIRVLGPRTDKELGDWLKQSAIFAMPSIYEGLGLSLQEALFYGCACVGTRCGGVTDLIQNGDTGLLVPAGQVAPLADALEKLMSDPALREKLSARGSQSMLEKGMTADRMVQAYEQLYAEILSRRS